jgi:phosphate starvation-inducible PhoH-like protein
MIEENSDWNGVDTNSIEVDGLQTGIKRGRKNIKTPLKFEIQLNDEQKRVKSSMLSDAVSVLTGKAGSGKSLLACQVALEYLFFREIDQIVITRPTVSDEDIGFLPGDMNEKMMPWMSPIYSNMHMLSGKTKIDSLVAKGQIEIAPISFMRGRTFVRSCVIVDEAQNITKSQMEMVLTRIGIGSKMIIVGDDSQTDLKAKKSGFPYLLEMSNVVDGLSLYELKTNHRHPIVDAILDEFKKLG